jgi:hypothetical protein
VCDLLGRQGRGGPNRTPFAFAAIRPALVRSTIKLRSKSAMPANTVSTMRPAGVVVSAHGSASERRPAPASLIRSAIARRSPSIGRGGLAGDRHHVAGRKWSSIRASSGRSALRPGSLFLEDADAAGRARAARCWSRSWPRVETRA